MSANVGFVDIMEPRHTDSGIFSFMTRSWKPHTTLTLDKYLSPQELKDIVTNSVYLEAVMESETARTGVRKEKLRQEVISYLDEMGFEKKIHVIRWMGVVFLKISFMMRIKLYVNQPAVLKLKATMGNNPVLFLPTHRSYADFCLMTYLCYHYDIDFPTVAAGMDFYSMAVIGRRMRETCAFYIRRSLVGAPLYAATLKQYVRTVVARHCAPVEFFIEGTRSRSNKSLPPKYGMLSMALMPLLAREVSDITIVPVNISYDRLMEQALFACEHLGVPKPKESTGGFLKALRSLNDHFGNIYINLGDPISVREHLKNVTSRSTETLKPIDLQQITPEQFKMVQDVAEHAVAKQQECTVATIANLTALALMQSIINCKPLYIDELIKEVDYTLSVLCKLGAKVFENDVRKSVERILVVHKKLMTLDKDRRLRLIIEATMEMSEDMKKKMKGHMLSSETMAVALPVIQLQLCVNPVLHYMVPAALVCLVASRAPLSRADLRHVYESLSDELADRYRRVRKLLSHEFFHLEKTEENTFDKAVEYCVQNRAISNIGELYTSGGDAKLQSLLSCSVWPALTTLMMCANVMTENVNCGHKEVLKLIQQRAESSQSHPYCLSLEATTNCLQGLVVSGALIKDKTKQEQTYQVVPQIMEECRRLVSSVLPSIDTHFGRTNPVLLDQRSLARL